MLRLHRALAPVGAPLALAIGNFDGVHLGHQAILATCRNTASLLGFQPAALTFEPLPREFFSPATAPARLMSMSEKLAAFARVGIAHAFVPRFDRAFSQQTPDEFIAKLAAMDVRHILLGDDFRFGAKRAGDVAMLKKHFTVTLIDDVLAGTKRVSSTTVRAALAAGHVNDATALLGAPYRIIGRVMHGKKLGRTLGFPTANIALGTHARRRKPALAGVYAVECRLVTRGLEGVAELDGAGRGDVIQGVANLGTNPVVSAENHHHLEVFLFDFSGDLYGQRLAVTFIEKIRDEQKFSGLDALVVQMHDDCAKAKTILSRK